MGHDHSHAGHQHSHGESTKNLGIAFFLNLGFAIIEIIGGLWKNSVAIISDAVHDFGGAFSLGVSFHGNDSPFVSSGSRELFGNDVVGGSRACRERFCGFAIDEGKFNQSTGRDVAFAGGCFRMAGRVDR